MSNASTNPRKGRGPLFYAGLMFAAYGAVAALMITDSVSGAMAYGLMVAPFGFVFPLIKAANERIDTGGPSCIAKGAAQKRYMKRVAMCTALYLATLALLTFVSREYDPGAELRAFLALLPGLAIVGIFWAISRLIVEEQDEFLRMLIIRQALIASGLALSAASVWGFLETADVVVHIDAYWWAVVWFFGLGVGAVVNRIQYGTWGAV